MTVHVIPINDLMVHHESMPCPCNPKRDIECSDVIVHNAYDGRDIIEQQGDLNETVSPSKPIRNTN